MSMVIGKAIKLIDVVASGAYSLGDIAKLSGMSRSTTHRLLSTLVEHNYLYFDQKHYGLGFRLLELGEQKKRSLHFVDALHGILVRYAGITSDTIHLAILDGTDIVIVDRIAGTRQLQIDSFVGQRTPAVMTAVGKALIGQTDPDGWLDYLDVLPPGYPKSREAILRELDTARLENYAFDFDECSIGTCGVASTFPFNDTTRLACSINGATVYFEDDRLESLVPMALEMADELRRAGASSPAQAGAGSSRASPTR
ncbi:IclR family transcriptional regulator [Acuticoccus sediminis]|uniref:IclR family transcriptional regulator n=1 Tax=Acuticoccus sediminis TaxID=2184697 RepID=A0A8B2NEV2_9HYPH|nr:IclR family transcriptional regulator [Acuticoccus sediminis]RAH97387.1 IclR family transcriptional regulator [Acuticoccus sediminis]